MSEIITLIQPATGNEYAVITEEHSAADIAKWLVQQNMHKEVLAELNYLNTIDLRKDLRNNLEEITDKLTDIICSLENID